MNVGIIGLGLIGGSLALDLRARGHYVWGISRNPDTCETAIAIEAVDAASHDAMAIATLRPADIVVLCTPLDAILPVLAAIAPHLQQHSPAAIVTDVGSVKAAIVAGGQALWPRFAGSHPMAGTEQSGIHAAISDLFRDRLCAVVPHADAAVTAAVKTLWESVGATVCECDAEAHDRAVATISHLPVVVSASLILTGDRIPDPQIRQLAQGLASSGFRDTSRVGGGNPELGRLMAEGNRTHLLAAIDAYRLTLDELRDAIYAGRWTELQTLLQLARDARAAFVE